MQSQYESYIGSHEITNAHTELNIGAAVHKSPAKWSLIRMTRAKVPIQYSYPLTGIKWMLGSVKLARKT